MSTLLVTSLRHTSSSSNNVVLDSGGNATFAANTSVAGNLLFNSGFGSATIAYGCRAWVNFNGTGTVAIRASGNVSSITDNGTGNYTINFTTAMSDANYMIAGTITRSGFPQTGTIGPRDGGTFTASALQISTCDDGGIAIDPPYVGAAIHR